MLTPWKKSYDQPRQHIQKQRHYFGNKGPSGQGCGFSSGHVWMWELDCEEGWAPKNWCFWTVVPGSSPSGSRVIRRWGRSRCPGKNLFNYRYRGRLETDSVVGELVEKRGWITGLHGIPITTYVGPRRLSILPKERRHWGLPSPISEAQAELAGLVSTHISEGNSGRKAESKKETTRGNQSFQKLIPFLYYLGLLIYLLLHVGMNTESHGGQQTWPLSQSGASYKIIQRS